MKKKNTNSIFIKDCAAAAFVQLCKKSSYQSISIVEICRRAGIGRTSFYRYFNRYDGKKDIIFYIVEKSWHKYLTLNEKKYIQNPELVFLEFLYDNKTAFIWLYQNGLFDIMFDIFYSTTVHESENDTPEIYNEAYLAGAIFGVVYHWCRRNFSDTPETIYLKLNTTDANEK